MAYSVEHWAFSTPIGTGVGDTTLQAAPGAGRSLMVQRLTVVITTAAAQAFDIEDSDGTVELFKAPASLAATATVILDYGPLGVALTANTGLVFNTAAAGVGLTIAAHGYVREG